MVVNKTEVYIRIYIEKEQCYDNWEGVMAQGKVHGQVSLAR